MNRAYTPDNTKSSIAIVISFAIAVALVAVLIGLSDKPNVDRLAVVGISGSAPADDFGFDDEDFGFDEDNLPGELDEAGNLILDDEALAEAQAADSTPVLLDDAPTPAPTSAQAPTSVPGPTPAAAAAVEPTPIPSPIPTADPTAIPLASGSVPTLSSGTVEGAFFTGGPQNEGATVARNQVVVSFNTDGSGTFTGALDITRADGSRVYLEMSGDLVWTSANPQVEATVTGTYGFDAVIEADDVAAEEGTLTITSLTSGSGSLCAPASECFGFTFPPQL